MLDNPKGFLIIIVAAILSMTLIISVTRQYIADTEAQSTFVLSLNTATEHTSSTKSSSSSPTPSITKKTANGESHAVTPSTKADYTITYTSSGGFKPSLLTIKAGKSVRFLNQSSKSLQVMNATINPPYNFGGFGAPRSVGFGGYYDYTFSGSGTLVYFNNNDKSKSGTIVIEP